MLIWKYTFHLLKFQQPQEVSCPSPVIYIDHLHHISDKFMLSVGTGKATPDQIQIKFVDSQAC